jgi:nucleoid DNA-binding protein
MAKVKGASPLTEREFVDELHKRLPESISRAQAGAVVKALKEELTDCMANGYKITLGGVLTLTPTVKPGRKKGDKVRNPFDGTTKTLRADEPPKYKVKAKVSSTVVKAFPSPKSKDGIALIEQLTPAKKKTKKA